MKRILVPTDFSGAANKARDFAALLASQFGSELVILHTYQAPQAGAAVMISIEDIVYQDAEKALDRDRKALEASHPKVVVQTRFRRGSLAGAVPEFCKEEGVDLIVMGTTGASGWEGKLFGSNTSRMIGKVNIPVFAIPEHAALHAFPNRVMVATDLLNYVQEDVFKPLRQLVEPFDSKVEFVNVIDAETSSRKLQKEKAANFDEWFDADYHPFHFKEHADIETAILEYMDKKPSDLFVVIAQQRGFWENLFRKSISRALVQHGNVPLLILPALKS